MEEVPIEIVSLDELNRLTRSSASASQTNDIQRTLDDEDQLWSRLLATAQSSKVSDKHLTAACNAICLHVRTTSTVQIHGAKSSAASTTTWRQTFQVARRALVAGKSKPALQVLDTLASLTGQLPQKQDAIDVVEEATYEMATIVYIQQSRQLLKEACIVLYFFLRKLSDFMSATGVFDRALKDSFAAHHRLCASTNVFSHDLGQYSVEPWLHFIFSLLLAVNVAESKSAALKLLSLLCTNNANLQYPDLITITGKAIDIYSATKVSALDEITKEVLPAILTSSEKYHDFFAKQMTFRDVSLYKLEVILGILVYGKSRSYVAEADLPNLCNEITSLFMVNSGACDNIDSILLLLSHASSDVRLRVLNLLLASTSPNSSLTSDTLQVLVKGLASLHNDTDAFYRGEILSIFRRFLTRLQHSYRFLERSQSKASIKSQDAYVTFCLQYWNFLASEISVHHTYGRNVLALDILSLIAEKFWFHAPFCQIKLAEEEFLSALFQLSVNPYDDIRMLSILVLQNVIGTKGLDVHSSVALANALSHVSQLAARTNRADHADALGRLIGLSQGASAVAEQRLQQAEHDIYDLAGLVAGLSEHLRTLDHFNVTSSYPLHGNLLGVRYVLEGSRTGAHAPITLGLCKKLLLVALRIWELSQPHLCVDSPEVETDQNSEVDYAGPKDTLAYAWRALRDSNLMMQTILNCSGHGQEVISEIGSLCFNQLTRLRHRGAFSTVAQTFIVCCQKSRASLSINVQALSSEWFAAALKELMNQAEKLTRRSAGLPAMFIALLDPGDSHNFSTSMSEIIMLATAPTPKVIGSTNQDKLQLPQVHALNCLKDIMTNSRFRTMTEALVVPMIELAAQCMNSHIWAIKNCGLMLFRASINRLDPDSAIGTAQAGINAQTFFYRGTRPIDVAFSLLATSHSPEVPNGTRLVCERNIVGNKSITESIFAGLDLMGRLYIKKSDKFRAMSRVSEHMSNNIWHVRAQVARLLVDMTAPNEEAAFMADILDSLNYCTDLNECHCRLLVIQGLLARLQTNSAKLQYQEKFTDDLIRISDHIWQASSGDNYVLWLKIVDQINDIRSADSHSFEKVISTYQKRLDDSFRHKFQSHALYDRALAQALIQSYIDGRKISLDLIIQHMGIDEDITIHVFRQPLPLLSFVQCNRYFDIVLAILPTVKSEEARAAVIETAVACLSQEFQLEYRLKVDTLVKILNFDQCIARITLVSQLSLYTALCKTTSLSDTENFTKLQKLSSAYCLHLRFAANDQIEDSTRWAAVKSLQQWQKSCHLDTMLRAFFDPNDILELFLIIYDLLNDDDEDIRAAITGIATSFCQLSTTTYQETSSICALASRELLRDRIVALFSKNERLALECLKRLLDYQAPLSRHGSSNDLAQYCQRYTVENRITELAAVANDLFAEEKQNLYTDEIDELMVWSEIFKQAHCGISNGLNSVLFSWVMEGLQSVQRLLTTDGHFKSHLGITNESTETLSTDFSRSRHKISGINLSQDLEVLVLRIIIIANILIEIESNKGAIEPIYKSITQLRLTCQHLHLPRVILNAFTDFA